jgi:polar amino acid transport system substrate-binding protein
MLMNRRDFLNVLTSAGVAAGVAGVTAKVAKPEAARAAKDAAERILDTRKMTCGYVVYAPYLMKDPNTGKFSGIFYDLTQKIAEIADFETEWAVETTYGALPEDIRSQKYDIFSGGLWPQVKQAKDVNYSKASFYAGLGIYVRANDYRFDDDYRKLDNPRYRITTIDGEMSQIVQQSDFSNASVLGLPDVSDNSLLAENVATGKADATFIEKAVANLYLLKNPGTLRNLCDERPIRIFENTWAFAHNAPRLKSVIDTAVKEMLYSGFVDKVLAKYEQVPESFYRVRAPIQ